MRRWPDETGGERGATYDEAFRDLAAQGVDVHGEAAYVAALVAPGAEVLDAGCGTGRVAVELAARGYAVTGADNDASMMAVARRHEGVRWVDADLAELDLGETFDLVVAAGNVVVFLDEGTEAQVVARLAAHLAPGGLLVCGWRTDRLDVATYDEWAKAAGLQEVARHATWQGAFWTEDADWCVSVDRRPQPAEPTGPQPAQPTGPQPAEPTGPQPAEPTGPDPAE